MGIRINYNTLAHDITVPNAYIQIESVTTNLNPPKNDDGTAGTMYHSIDIAIYKSKAAFNNGKPPIERQTLRRDYVQGEGFNIGNFNSWLKAQPSFVGAVDE